MLKCRTAIGGPAPVPAKQQELVAVVVHKCAALHPDEAAGRAATWRPCLQQWGCLGQPRPPVDASRGLIKDAERHRPNRHVWACRCVCCAFGPGSSINSAALRQILPCLPKHELCVDMSLTCADACGDAAAGEDEAAKSTPVNTSTRRSRNTTLLTTSM